MDNKRYIVGFGGLAVVLIIVAAFSFFGGGGGSTTVNGVPTASLTPITVKGYYGGEKSELLRDPDILRILQDRYKITINAKSLGSIEMVRDVPLTDEDFLWPSSQVAVALYKQRGGHISGVENIFNSPIVLYSWKDVTEGLIKAGIVKQEGGAYYVIDFKKLMQMIVDGKRWSDVGVTTANGKILIRTTNPTVSNGGNLFAGLLANTLNDGNPVDHSSIQAVLPQLRTFFKSLGFKDEKSSDLWQQFLTLKYGRPLISGYESQLIGFKLQNPDAYKQQYQDIVRILYPQPTVWSSHPIIARSNNGKRLIEAFKDPEIQRIAWERHGFRSGLPGARNDPRQLGMDGIPENINSVMDMPEPDIMEQIIIELSKP